MNTEATVFIIDDDPAVRKSVAALVGEMGIRTELFSSAEDFLSAYDPDRSGCLVTDVRMLGMSGVELQEKLAVDGVILPVIIITAHADIPLTVRAMQTGAITLLEKPCREQELWDTIQTAIQQDAARRRTKVQDRGLRSRFATLTGPEREVLDLVVSGKLNKVVASTLGIPLRTVEDRRQKIMRKLGVESLAELVQIVIESRHLSDSAR